MATTVPRSVFASRDTSPHREGRQGSRGHLRPASSKGPSYNQVLDDKVTVQDSAVLAATQDADSMKYPIDTYNSTLKQDAYFDDSFTDFGKSLIDDDYLKGFGLLERRTRNASPNSRLNSRGHSRRASRGTLHPTDAMPSAPSVYELDVSHAPFSTHSTPERGGLRPLETKSPNRGTSRPSNDTVRAGTPEQALHNGARRPSAPLMKASPESPKKVKRLSGFSLRSVKSAFSRNDFPEVVQPPSPTKQQRQPNDPPRPTPQTSRRADPRRDYAPPHSADPRNHYNSQFAPRQPRAMASTPHLNQQISPSPVVPRPWMTRRTSAGSIRSTMSNINKPLPPEPGQMQLEMLHPRAPPTPARTPTTPSRAPMTPMTSSPIRGRGEVPPSPANHQFMANSRRANTAPSQPGLRSRYTPKDLDALDDAFARSILSSSNTNGVHGSSLAIDPLDPIKESPRASKQHLDISAPLQVARGPMRMEPSRRPPPTPGSRNRSPATGARSGMATPEPSKPAPLHEQVVATPVMAIRPSEPQVETSMHLGGGRAKVQQLLGEGAQPNEPNTERERNTDGQAGFKSGQADGRDAEMPEGPAQPVEQPPAHELIFGAPSASASQSMTRAESTQMTRSESFSSISGAFRNGTSDVQFNEIRRRLELLSPTTTTDTSFMSSQIIGQILSAQNQSQGQDQFICTALNSRQEDIEPTETEALRNGAEHPVENELPGDNVLPRSFSPVELPTEANWAGGMAGSIAELCEMAGSASPAASPRVSIQPATPAQLLAEFIPPPIPESPKQDSRVRHSHAQSMLSSGSGRTKSMRSIKSARSARSAKARSITSAAASEIPELYAGLPSPRTTLASRRPSVTWEDEEVPEMPPMPEIMTTEELEELDAISADTAEQVLYQILRNLMNPRDLFNASLVSRGFQRTFIRHDTKLLRNSLWYTSPPAWEHLEMHMPISPETGQLEYPSEIYRQQWVHSMRNLTKLKAMILQHCTPSLSPLTALMLETKESKHSTPVDDAIWRIWTFCKIFGEDENRREDLELQMQWIKGHTIVEAQARRSESRTINAQEYPAFGFGNDQGLSPEELMRMGEIWLCLRVLVRGYRGQRREAREFGIFEGTSVPAGDTVMENAILDEWMIYLLSLAPGTNLEVLCPGTATQENFITAESLGFTIWSPPGPNFTSSGFLTGPVCSVLEEWLNNDARKNTRASADEGTVHPAFRTQQVFPSRQQVGLFVDRLRTVEDVLVRPQPDRKPSVIPGSADSAKSVQSISKTPSKMLKASKPPMPMQVDSPGVAPSKSVKDASKKAALKDFGSKLSLRLPSRSLTAKSKLQLPMSDRRPSTTGSTSGAEVDTPAEEAKAGGIFSRSKSTKSRIFSRNQTKSRRNNELTALGPNGLTAVQLDIPPVPSSRESSRGNPVATDATRSNSVIITYDKLPVHSETSGIAASPGATDPGTLARKHLIDMGYDEARVDAVVAEVSTEYGVDFEGALKKLKKSKKLEDRLQRLDRMG